MNPMKKQFTRREIEELLTRAAPAEPPAGLAERIKAEIPSPLTLVAPAPEPQAEVGAGQPDEMPANVIRPAAWIRWRPLLAAASLAATLGAGVFAYFGFVRVAPLSAPEAVSERDAQKRESFAAPPPAAASPLPSAKAMPRAPSLATAPEGMLGGVAQPVEVPEALPQVGREEARRRDQDAAAWKVDGVEIKDMAAIGQSPDSSYYEFESHEEMQEEITVTSESPLLDRRAVTVPKPDLQKIPTARDPWEVLQQAPGVTVDRINAGGNEKLKASGYVAGGVEGGVAGGVPGGTPGGIIGGVPSGGDAPLRVGGEAAAAAPSTGGTAEPNDQAYGDVFFRDYGVNPAIDTEDDRFSTFGLDVDTGSYTVTRRYLEDGHLPPREAIRVEEFVNFFDYGDQPPRDGDFALFAEAAPTPFAKGDRYRLVRFAVKAREITPRDRKPALLIFTVDVSGSMDQENRLELVKRSLSLLLSELQREDRVGLVVYGTNGRVLLEPTSDHAAIGRAIEGLVAEGSTNAEEGLLLAYELADRYFRPGAINRVILCSDGVANVGATGPESIGSRIEAAAGKGIELTTVGFGMGNYNDVLMEQLADRGDGSYAYVDDLEEARRIFVENLTGTLQTVAGDAKVQVEWNPDVVARWRLLGYENRDIADEKFRDDTVDAGEIGSAHAVTALYEVKLQPDVPRQAVAATLFLRWRSRVGGEVEETAKKLYLSDFADSWQDGSPALRLASVAAELAEQLKGSYWAKDGSYRDLLRRAQSVSADFRGRAEVAELASLIGKAGRLAKASEDEPEESEQ